MSKTMDYGIIGMPFDMAMGNELSRRQFYSRAQAILAERDQLSVAIDGAQERAELLLKAKNNWADRARAAEADRDRLRAEVESLRANSDEPELFTCTGKGGTYEKVSSALGAGPLRGQHFMVYRSETDYFVREYEDFQARMEPISILLAAKEPTK